MLRRRLPTIHVLSLVALHTAQDAIAADLPYNPTRIFLDKTSNYAYILQPDTDSDSNSDGQAQLLSIDISKSLEASSLTQNTLYSTLPFLDADSRKAVLSVYDGSGNITVVASDCSDEDGQRIWSFAPDSSKKNGNGTWTQRTLSSQATSQGVKYLSGGISFSEMVKGNSSDTNLYMFGGMCPLANSTATTWTTTANYSNSMIEYSAVGGKGGNVSYTTNMIANRGPPVVEAGFSITPLTPAYSANTSDGTQTQQQSFILVGGHTHGAFINMSSVALFSLPQQGWTFAPVNQPSSSSAKTSTVVEPRSGHTAVLTEDGTSIVVFGGWVGDVTTPASPQLAVLKLGSGYGGTGDWAWTVPSSGSANLTGSGLYGHGALMLPGGVMMLAGGYTIPTATSKSRFLRRAAQTSNSQTLFYNVSSHSWLSTYDPPASVTSMASSADNQRTGALRTTSQKAGLGVGLTIGVLLVIGLVLYYLWYSRRTRRREARMSDKEGLVRRSDTFDNTWFGASGIDGRGGADAAGGMWNGGEKMNGPAGGYTWLPQDPNSEQPMTQSRSEVERSGLLVNAPSPTRGLRKGAPSRAQYQYHAAPRYDDGRISRASGNIHPIEERDEEEDRLSSVNGDRPLTPAQRQLRALESLLGDNGPSEDPFKDPLPNPLRSHPVSPDLSLLAGPGVRRSGTNATNATNVSNTTAGTDQVSGWIREWTASYAASLRPTSDNPHSHSSGRASPTKTDERTSSNLSEESNRSGISAIARTSSTRSGLFFGASGTPSITPQYSPVEERFTIAPTNGRSRSPLHSEYNPNTEYSSQLVVPIRPSAHRSATVESHNTTCTTWGQLMEQSEALLGSAEPSKIVPLNYPKRRHSEKPQQTSTAELLANAGPAPPIPPRRRLGWMGSIRRALGTHDRSFSSAAPLNPHHAYTLSSSIQPMMQQYHDRSATNSPTKGYRQGATSRAGASSSMSNGPRRATSDSSEFLRLKRGRQDWERENEPDDPRWIPYHDDPPSPDLGDWGEAMVPEIQIQKHYSNASASHKPKAPTTPQRSGTSQSVRPRDSALIRLVDEQDDWDVETAAAKRDVQVMFTLPKARLRVVNADPDRMSQRSISEGGVSVNSAHSSPNPAAGGPSTAFIPYRPDVGAAANVAGAAVPSAAEHAMARARGKSEASSLESFRTARGGAVSGAEDEERNSGETVRKPSSYGIEIMDWEREALERRDGSEEAKARKGSKVV